MAQPTVHPAHEVPAAAEYRALVEHCTDCRRCRTATAVACPEAGRLRRAWSLARRAGSSALQKFPEEGQA